LTVPVTHGARVTGLNELLFDLHESSTIPASKRLTQDQLIAIFDANAQRRRHGRHRKHDTVLPRTKVRRLLFHNDPSLATPTNRKRINEFMQDPATWFGLDVDHWTSLYRILSWRPDIDVMMEPYSSYDDVRTVPPCIRHAPLTQL